MKSSLYNVFFPYRQVNIIYNTLWNTSAVTKKEEKEICDILKRYESDATMSNEDENILSILKSRKFLVDDWIDEKEVISQRIYATNHDNEKLEIIVVPTLACNFRCWYCYEKHDVKTRISRNEVRNIVKYVERQISEKKLKEVSISFFGGEPFLCYETVMLPLLKQAYKICNDKGVRLVASATTNASLITEERLSTLITLGWNFMQITLDGNKSRHDMVRYSGRGKGSYDTIINNVAMALCHHIRILLRINISEDTHLDVEQLLQSFCFLQGDEKDFLTFHIQRVWQAPKEVEDIVSDIVAKIRLKGFRCVYVYSNPSSIWNSCYADKENEIVVNPKGEIFKCTARDFSRGQVEGVLNDEGVITWNGLHKTRESNSVFENTECSKCSILPICGGGCSQKLLESKHNQCPRFLTTDEKIGYARKVFLEKMENRERI